MMSGPMCGGIDVSKARLDVALRPTAEPWSVRHDEPGTRRLVARLLGSAPRAVRRGIQTHLAWLNRRLAALDAEEPVI